MKLIETIERCEKLVLEEIDGKIVDVKIPMERKEFVILGI